MSRSQDTVIDDDEESCPLCIEEFDLSDKNFRPCPCGYQICQFCFNSLKTTYEKSTCPNCRRPYDESTIQYKIPTAEEFKADLMNKNKKQAAAKRKETEKREVETSSRRNLAGVRVKQQNLVYVIGLEPTKKDESMLLDTLRGKDYFGQYGDIEKIVVSKAKPGATNQGIGVYVTFKRKEDAAMCIEAVDGSQNGDRILRAQYGTTKYCSAFLRGEVCMNKNCSFLHETGEDGHHISIQNEPSNSQAPPRSIIHTQPSQISRPQLTSQPSNISQPMARQSSRDTTDSRKESSDASALPATAGWANANAPVARARRASQVASRGTPSPQISNATPAIPKAEIAKPTEPVMSQPTVPVAATKSKSISSSSSPVNIPEKAVPQKELFPSIFDDLRRRLTIEAVTFHYDDSWMTAEEREKINELPPMYDLYGGAKRRLMEDKEAAEHARIESEAKAKLEAQATSAAEDALEDDQMAAGSLALGGEPEDNSRSTSARGAITRPGQTGSAGLDVGQFSNLRIQSPQQVSHSSGIQRAPGLPQPPVQNTAFEMSDFDRRGPQYSQAQYEQINNHQRNGSRYFNNDSKSGSNNRFQNQQQSFYSSGIQGPPPGLPTAGTPPVSGGGMFAHGQGFTNTGFGNKENNDIHMRGRSGTNAGHDLSKRELLISLQNNPLRSPPLQTSALGVLNPLYGQYSGAYQDPGLVKQRKKGKKHRHANTSSSGGGVEHLADPSILQARIHQSGATGQGGFGGNQVDDQDFPPLPMKSSTAQPTELHTRVSSFQSFIGTSTRSSTPKIPPGFEITHAHPNPLPGRSSERSSPQKALGIIAPVLPAVPILSNDQRSSTPKSKLSRPMDALFKAKEQDVANIADEQTVNVALTSPASPKPKSESKQPQQTMEEQNKSVVNEKADNTLKDTTQISKPTSVVVDSPKSKQNQQRPSKIEIPKSLTSADIGTNTALAEKSTASVVDHTIVETPSAIESQPATPVTAASEVSRVSSARPRTIRLTTSMIQKAEAANAASPAIEKSAILPALSMTKEQHSRQPSLSSISRSRPSTPSISGQLMSQDVSRAGSPPPSNIVGSAPTRSKTKAQQKKERREKAKKTEDAIDSASVTSVPAAPVVEAVGPIVARQKKQKKSKTNGSSDIAKVRELQSTPRTVQVDESVVPSTTVQASQSGKTIEDEILDEVTEEQDENIKETIAESVARRSYTVRDLCTDVANMSNDPAAIQKLLTEHVTPMTKLVGEMLATGDLTRDHPWLKPPSFNSAAFKLPQDGRKGQEYLDGNGYSNNDAFGYVYLPQKEKRALYAGHAVSVADTGDRKNDLLRRCLITPNGWVMRHLSAEESERVLELEERRSLYAEEFGDIGIMDGLGVLEQDDFVNLGGGIEDLGRYGDRHGVCWVVGDEHGEDTIEGYDDVDEDDLLNELGGDGLSDETDEDLGLDLNPGNHQPMPGSWDQSFNNNTQVSKSNDLPPNTLPPININSSRSGAASASVTHRTVNLRAMDTDALHKRIHEKQKEVDTARKEAEKIEKALGKRSREFARWKDAVLKV